MEYDHNENRKISGTDSRVLILASASPRRRQLLELAGIPFEVRISHAPETTQETQPGRIAEDLSFHKAWAVWQTLSEEEKESGRIVLGADTIVWQKGKVMGKPKDADDARHMLRALQGDSNSVFTGVTLLRQGETITFHSETKVFVHEMDEQEIEWYISTGEPFDKAGGYGIQGPFAVFVKEISGDYHNVVGLPVAEVYQRLRHMGFFGS